MPELPEVETVRRTLESRIVGDQIVALKTSGLALRLGHELDLAELKRALVGAEIRSISRRAKVLLIDTDRETVLLVHLGMTGRLAVATHSEKAPPHTHVELQLASGRLLRFVDPRRFGDVRTLLRSELATARELAHLGIEPLSAEFTAEHLFALTRLAKTPMKSLLLDQRRIAGLGNIYVCEALFHAGISPALPAGTLSRSQAQSLQQAIVKVLRQGLDNRGTTFRDFVDGDGRKGQNRAALAVYLREGEPCKGHCGAAVARIVQSGRSTFYCPRCQSTKAASRRKK